MGKRSFKEKKRLLYRISVIPVLMSMIWGALMFYDCAARPTVPNQETGTVYSKQCHGTTVYVTLVESILWIALPLAVFTMFIILVLINRSLKRDDGWILPVDSDDQPL